MINQSGQSINIKLSVNPFADNQIPRRVSRALPDAVPALTEIGPRCLADNELTSVELPARDDHWAVASAIIVEHIDVGESHDHRQPT